MLREILKKHIKSQAAYVEVGYGQVEPNHLSAQRTAQIYAQLPADPAINILEQGQFVKYDYKAGLVNFEGLGEWMLVYNETKLYREHQLDCEFAMIKGNYQARVYSPLDGNKSAEEMYGPTRFLQGDRERWNGSEFVNENFKIGDQEVSEIPVYEDGIATDRVADYSVASKVHDYYEMNDINDPAIEEDYRRRLFMKLRAVKHPEAMMPTGATMVPRVFKTNVGDHYTTNMINETSLAVGDLLYVGANGILSKTKNATEVAADAEKGILKTAPSGDMAWQVVKVYTMPDHQRGVKIMRIA
jgi:hypothetical protein